MSLFIPAQQGYLVDWHKIALSIAPKNLISFIVGVLVRLKLPLRLSQILNRRFAKAFSLNMAEAEQPLGHYRTIEEVFTRRLKTGTRTWDASLCSPADGYVLRSAPVAAGDQATQVKGISYSLNELMYGTSAPAEKPRDFSPAWYTTVYLAPHNYHRVHTPLAGTLTCIRYIPGTLWPVNDRFTQLIPGLLCQNERMVFELLTAEGGKIMIIMVGAFNVGRIASAHAPELTTNLSTRQLRRGAGCGIREKNVSIPLATAAELGVFMLGSTVVVILDEITTRHYAPQQISAKQTIKVGEKL